jgi:hypothetical protein
MTVRSGLAISACLLLICSVARAALQAEPVQTGDAQNWVRFTVPMPRQIEIAGKVAMTAGEVRLVADETVPLAAQAVKELREVLGEARDGFAGKLFTIELKLAPADMADLTDVPNRDQAYVVRPTHNGLELVGGGVRGLYYASKTLQQLIGARASNGRVEIPIVSIKDWPDMEDRGFWGGDSFNHLRWMSDHKLNYDEQISHTGVDKQGVCRVKLHGDKQKIIDEGPKYGINPVPVVLHLEQLSSSGIFEAYPELKGKDGFEGAICYSNPKFVDLLAQWLVLWKSTPGVKEVDVWMAENLQQQKGCQCDGCRKEDRSVLEARAIVAAYKKARLAQPDLALRMLTSEETEKANPRVFAEVPPEVKIWYYHSLFTYNTSEKPMLRPYLSEAVKQGRWLGVCPNMCAHVGTWQPFTGAQFMHYRMNEFIGKGVRGFIGYAVPEIPLVRFNAEAAAEWSWNVNGRSPREFAIAYAVRRGIQDPQKFAEWSETCGPVAWDIYGSEFPAGENRKFPGKLAELLKTGKLPEFGEVLWEVFPIPWGDIKNVEQLNQDVVNADRAVQLARELGVPEYIQESLIVQGYIRTLKALSELKSLVKSGAVAEADRPAARKQFAAYVAGLDQAGKALADWEQSVPDSPKRVHWVKTAMELLTTMTASMKQTASDLGCGL